MGKKQGKKYLSIYICVCVCVCVCVCMYIFMCLCITELLVIHPKKLRLMFTRKTICGLVTKSRLTLLDRSPSGSSVHGILQGRTLEWFPFPSSEDLPDPGTEPSSPLAGGFFIIEPPGKSVNS